MFEWDGNVLPVQISANIILVLSETPLILREAETCSNLEEYNTISQRLISTYSHILMR